MLLNAKLHRDNSLLMHDFIPALKANAIHMIGEIIVDYLGESSSGSGVHRTLLFFSGNPAKTYKIL